MKEEYQRLAMRTLNPDLNKKDVLINGVMGLCGESGEAIDIVKKHLAQGHELDKEIYYVNLFCNFSTQKSPTAIVL